MGRPGYLSEGIHAAPRRQEELHTVGVDPFSSGVQGGQTFLKHTGEGERHGEGRRLRPGPETRGHPPARLQGSELSTALLLGQWPHYLRFPNPRP